MIMKNITQQIKELESAKTELTKILLEKHKDNKNYILEFSSELNHIRLRLKYLKRQIKKSPSGKTERLRKLKHLA